MCAPTHLRRGDPPRNRRAAAFSLVEVIVVITVISIVIALALPSFRRVKQQAVDVRCMAHMRSASLAISMYANGADDAFPFAGRSEREIAYPSLPTRIERIGGGIGLRAGLWSMLLSEQWSAGRFDPAMQCPAQPPVDDAAEAAGGWVPGSSRLPMYWMSEALWCDPASLTADANLDAEPRTRANRQHEVLFPSSKAVLYEQVGFCITAPDAAFWIWDLAQTPMHPTSAATADGSVARSIRNDQIPGVGGAMPMTYTVDGVRGRDLH